MVAKFQISLLWCFLSFVEGDEDHCTTIGLGGGSTIEGSTIVTHNSDCQQCDPRIAFIPARDHMPGAQKAILPFQLNYPRYLAPDRSPLYALKGNEKERTPVGFIDQVPHTYAYWEGTYGIMNEHGLAIGESTASSKLIGWGIPTGGTSLLTIGDLVQLAMERCTVVKCAIRTMGDMAVRHGFYGEDPGFGGAGEVLTVADGSETWVFHVSSAVQNKSATWVAQRIPDGHVAVAANAFIIKTVNCKDDNNFMCAENMFATARAGNLCTFVTEAEFDFTACFSMDPKTLCVPGFNPFPSYFTLRRWRIMNLANPELDLKYIADDKYSLETNSYPFSVPIGRKVSRAEVMDWTRDYYKDTEFDMSRGIFAGPFGNPYRIEYGEGMKKFPGQYTRGISIPRTVYSTVLETKPRPQNRQSILWYSADQPMTGVFVPFAASSNRAAVEYQQGRPEEFSRDSAWWAFNFVSNWMNIQWGDMMARHVGPAIQEEQSHILNVVAELERNWPSDPETVNMVQQGLQQNVVKRWWALGDELIARYCDGVYRHKDTTYYNYGYPAWWLEMIGFNMDYYRVQWVQASSFPPTSLIHSLPACLQKSAAVVSLASRHMIGTVPTSNIGCLSLLLVGAVVGFAVSKLVGVRQNGDVAMKERLISQ